uniref:Uncharacterized protein n=1 Tax=Theileria annulata TaxID=5874 RepID=A0A3B0MPK4_THEAN
MESLVTEYDSIDLNLESEDSTYLSQNDKYFCIKNKSQLLEANECGIVNSYSLPEQCESIRRSNGEVHFSSRNKLFKLLQSETFGEKKFRERILDFLPLHSKYPLLVLICKKMKQLQLRVKKKVIVLEQYNDRCDSKVIYLDFFYETNHNTSVDISGSRSKNIEEMPVKNKSAVICVYKTESVVKYCLVGLEGNDMKLLKHDFLTEDIGVRVTKALLSEDLLAIFNDCFLVLSKDKDSQDYPFSQNIPLPSLSKKYTLFFKKCELVRLVNDYIVCTVSILENKLNFNFYELYSETHFHTFTLKLDYNVKHIHSMMYDDGMYKILIQSEELKFLVVSFYGELPTETISYYDHYKTFPEPIELEALIDSSEVVITNKLVDYIINNNLRTCAKKILKCIHLPEIGAVKLVKSDISLLDDFLLYTTGSDNEFKRAFKSEIDGGTFKVMLSNLLDKITERELERETKDVKKVIKIINALLDAKVMEQKDFDEEMIKRLQELVDGCQKEHLDLQSLLSYTNTLLDNKFKYNTNQLITTMDISLD